MIYEQNICPFLKAFCLPIICDKGIAPLISALFTKGRPSAIYFVIIAIIIYSIQGVFSGRPHTHVFDKILKPAPALTHINTTCAIVLIIAVSFIITPVAHLGPYTVFGGFRHAMSYLPFGGIYMFSASAGFCLAGFYGANGGNKFLIANWTDKNASRIFSDIRLDNSGQYTCANFLTIGVSVSRPHCQLFEQK